MAVSPVLLICGGGAFFRGAPPRSRGSPGPRAGWYGLWPSAPQPSWGGGGASSLSISWVPPPPAGRRASARAGRGHSLPPRSPPPPPFLKEDLDFPLATGGSSEGISPSHPHHPLGRDAEEPDSGEARSKGASPPHPSRPSRRRLGPGVWAPAPQAQREVGNGATTTTKVSGPAYGARTGTASETAAGGSAFDAPPSAPERTIRGIRSLRWRGNGLAVGELHAERAPRRPRRRAA